AQRNWADALREEYVALCNYRIAITDFERQKGTVLQYANVSIVDGTVPQCAEQHASRYLRQRHGTTRTAPLNHVSGDPNLPVVVDDVFPLPATLAAPPDLPAFRPVPSQPPRASLGSPTD